MGAESESESLISKGNCFTTFVLVGCVYICVPSDKMNNLRSVLKLSQTMKSQAIQTRGIKVAFPARHKATQVEKAMIVIGAFCAICPVPTWILYHLPEYRGETR